ncbi:hypothetical protein O2N63_00070 [Aliiroseovarius sp. KMU-50]|uniref:Uncharacterized protein n=1 Tax=Aliiroseovarius salicola TaxID=3009082 RepID=A0ABT4VW61_9RHOB|nr:hypothetical protein [Aliiroseovarius sp. KMU-50]MDA5092484.1 hypothetical protein [Aliiroseovarius sp. KMU-50]
MTDPETPDIATSKFIEEIVQQHWDEHGSACYLSNLGFRLKNELPESAAVLHDGLHEYLRRNPIVKVVQHPNIHQKIGAVPLSITVPDHVENLFAPKGKLAEPNRNVSYRQEFWDAFIKPIDGIVRIVCIGDHGEVEISDEQVAKMEGNCYKIFPDDLTKEMRGSPISERVAATHQAIELWLEKHLLGQEAFSVLKRPSSPRGTGHLQNLLNVFDGLSDEELSRISIPLDILVKLNSKK